MFYFKERIRKMHVFKRLWIIVFNYSNTNIVSEYVRHTKNKYKYNKIIEIKKINCAGNNHDKFLYL